MRGQVTWCASCASTRPPLRVRDRSSRPICRPWPATNAPVGGWQQSHLFAGEYWDQDAQLLYLRARWYDPQIGRFISADPFEGRQRDPRSLNRYIYGANNPVTNTDPSGEMTLGEMGTAMDIISTLAVGAIREVGMDLLLGKIGPQLVGAFSAMQTVGNWGGSPGGAALVSTLATMCYFNERSCLLRGVPTLASGVEMPFTTMHIAEGLMGLAETRRGPGRALPFVLSRVPSGANPRYWLDKTGVCPKPRPAGTVCDEYPYASTLQGGALNYYAGGVSVRLVPAWEQTTRQRNVLNNFYRGGQVDTGGLTPTSFFLNVVAPLPSFYLDRRGKKHLL